MPLDISLMPLRVLIDGHDTDGTLVLADNQLAAVFVRDVHRELDPKPGIREHPGSTREISGSPGMSGVPCQS